MHGLAFRIPSTYLVPELRRLKVTEHAVRLKAAEWHYELVCDANSLGCGAPVKFQPAKLNFEVGSVREECWQEMEISKIMQL